jgi:hypothetical protein
LVRLIYIWYIIEYAQVKSTQYRMIRAANVENSTQLICFLKHELVAKFEASTCVALPNDIRRSVRSLFLL